MSDTPLAAPWGTGVSITGTPFRQLVTSRQTDGRLVVLAAEMPPGLHVESHVHDTEDQITVVISGRVGAIVGNQEFALTEGSVQLLPRGIPHAQWNAGAEPARVLEIFTPGGLEHAFEDAGRRARTGEEP